MSLAERAWQMWAVHPLDLDELGFMTREEFYLAHLHAAAAAAQREGIETAAARCDTREVGWGGICGYREQEAADCAAAIRALLDERDAMRAALKAAFDMRLTNHPEWEAIARAAIAKAEGRTP